MTGVVEHLGNDPVATFPVLTLCTRAIPSVCGEAKDGHLMVFVARLQHGTRKVRMIW